MMIPRHPAARFTSQPKKEICDALNAKFQLLVLSEARKTLELKPELVKMLDNDERRRRQLTEAEEASSKVYAHLPKKRTEDPLASIFAVPHPSTNVRWHLPRPFRSPQLSMPGTTVVS